MRPVLVRLSAALTLGAAATAISLAGTTPAAAATCSVMTFQFDPSTGGVVLSPGKLTVDAGACVTFSNSTITPTQFTVGAHYKATAGAFSSATPNYVAGPAGTTQPVTATGAGGTAHASIVVKAAAVKPSPTATSSAAPAPRQTPAPKQSQRPAQQPPPTAVRPAPPAQIPTAAPPPVQPLTSQEPGSTPFLAGQPTPQPSSSTSSAPALVSGPLQPPSDRGTGLPAALAALAVVGTAGALLRVLLAEPISPVDDRRTVGATS